MQTTKNQLIERIKRAYYNDFSSDVAVITENEISLYINDAIALAIDKQTNEGYAITGILEIPDGYITTYSLPNLTADPITGYFYTTIPHPPMGITNSTGISSVFFSNLGTVSEPALYVSQREVNFFKKVPHRPSKIYYWIEGARLVVWSKVNLSTTTATINITMATNISQDGNTVLNVPPDAVDFVFETVMRRLFPRKNMTQENINDGNSPK